MSVAAVDASHRAVEDVVQPFLDLLKERLTYVAHGAAALTSPTERPAADRYRRTRIHARTLPCGVARRAQSVSATVTYGSRLGARHPNGRGQLFEIFDRATIGWRQNSLRIRLLALVSYGG